MADPTEPVKSEAKAKPNEEGGSEATKSSVREGNGDTSRPDRYDAYSLKVKPEYIRSERDPCLAPLPEAPSVTPQDANADAAEKNEDGKPLSGRQKRKRKKGMNKKRPRDVRQDPSEKICLATIRGDPCPFGESCKYSHDIKAFMATRSPDIKEVAGGCPNFNTYGRCIYGAMCRLGSSHINMSTGANITKHIDEAEVKKDADSLAIQSKTYLPVHEDFTLNFLPKDVQVQLRKNTYPFKCKRRSQGQNTPKTEVKEQTSPASAPDVQDSSSDPTPVELKTRKIIDFSQKVYVAPLTTVGNLPFRRIMKKFGADITCGEMAVATCLLQGSPQEWALLKRHKDEDVFGVQIAAAHADVFTRTCELIEAHTTVDFVDLNMGCPLDIICSKGAGAALMMREKKLKGALEGIVSTLSCPVTIKMRTGWDINNPFAHNLVRKIQSWGIEGIGALTIHGRSRLQRYSNLADWDYIQEVATSQSDDYPKIPVIGNGDIFSYTDYEKKKEKEGVSATAFLARGALIKPWLPTEIKEQRHWDISATERLDILREYVRFGLEHWGSDTQGVNNTRRFLLEWISFLHRYVPVGLLEVVPQQMNQRPPNHMSGRNDLETLFMSRNCADWIKISEMLLGPVPDNFRFEPKHKANGYA